MKNKGPFFLAILRTISFVILSSHQIRPEKYFCQLTQVLNVFLRINCLQNDFSFVETIDEHLFLCELVSYLERKVEIVLSRNLVISLGCEEIIARARRQFTRCFLCSQFVVFTQKSFEFEPSDKIYNETSLTFEP